MKEFIWTEDGRKAERITTNVMGVDGSGSVVTEIYVEPKVEKKLSMRVTEHSKPMVHTRETQKIDEVSGDIVETKVESMDAPVLSNVWHNDPVAANPVAAMNVEDDCDCSVTREEVKELMTAIFDAIHNKQVVANSEPVMSMQSVVEERVAAKEGTTLTWTSITLLAIIAAEGIGLLYFLT